LKNNPSDALRMAETDVVVVTSRDRPEAVLVHLDDEKLLGQAGVRTALAISLFKDDSLPLGACRATGRHGAGRLHAARVKARDPRAQGG
jgi:hypothetical protein